MAAVSLDDFNSNQVSQTGTGAGRYGKVDKQSVSFFTLPELNFLSPRALLRGARGTAYVCLLTPTRTEPEEGERLRETPTKDVLYWLVLRHLMHRCNTGNVYLQTFKESFLSCLTLVQYNVRQYLEACAQWPSNSPSCRVGAVHNS